MCVLGWEVGCDWGLGWVTCAFWWDFGFFLVGEVCFLKKKSSLSETLYLMMKGAGGYFYKGQDVIQVKCGIFSLSSLSVSVQVPAQCHPPSFISRLCCGI